MFHVKHRKMGVIDRERQRKQAAKDRAEVLDNMVRGITVYPNNVAMVNRLTIPGASHNGVYRRGKVKELSAKARARMLFVALSTSIEFKSMITLTYPQEFPTDGKVFKGHLDAMLKSLVDRYAVSYFWFLEFQTRRGAPHCHILLTRPNIFGADRKWLALRWAEIMGIQEGRRYSSLQDRREKDMFLQTLRVNTHPKTWEEIRTEQGARRYIAKYACKPEQKVVPERYQNVGRFYGYSRDVKAAIKPIDAFQVDAEIIRSILVAEGHKVSEWDYLPKYLFGVKSFADLTTVL